MDDFYTYGNVDELQKYMKKAQTLNTKLALCKEKIDQVITLPLPRPNYNIVCNLKSHCKI